VTLARRAALSAVLIAGYLLLDRASLMSGFTPVTITPWNPPVGLVLAVLLRRGPRFLPAVAVAVVLSDLINAAGTDTWPLVADAVAITLCYGVAARVLSRWPSFDDRLDHQRDVFILIGVAGSAAFVVSLVCVAGLVAGGEIAPHDFPQIATRYLIGDAIGLTVVAPLLLVHRRPRLPSARIMLEGGLQGAVVLAALLTVFGWRGGQSLGLFYLLFPPLIWVAVRFGVQGATLANLAAEIGLVVAFQTVVQDPNRIVDFQVRMLVLAAATLILGATVNGARRAEEALRQRRDQLAQVSRLSLAGEMAAALAHDLNQPLLANIAFTRAAQRLIGSANADPAKASAAMDKAVEQAERAAAIVRSLRGFLGTGGPDATRQDVAALIRGAAGLAETEHSQDGKTPVTVDLPPDLPQVDVDAVQVQQVLVNLIRNAIEAQAALPAARRTVLITAHPTGGEIEIVVADRGPGLAPEIAERLFQPFTTTKAGGMGMGLAICRTIVEAHGGRLWLAADGPDGCSFRFTLPVHREEP
jgi:signal transduction histidine kinase